ncbi:MAG: baseplate J/gp47 family protein [Enhydrobacter sp.]|nr:baseplate J/gp47 family protein [Enhydrobacter sp.]
MPYSRPSYAQLIARVGALYRAAFPGADTNLRQSAARPLVTMIAASTDDDLAFLDWLALQLFPFSADAEYLERWATAKGLSRRAATHGAGTVTLAGTPGSTALSGTQLQTAAGLTVALAASATIGGGGTVVAFANAVAGGANGNLATGVPLTFIGTPAGFGDAAVVATAFSGGADAETDSSLRARTLRAFAQPSFGGNRNDWENAALKVAGVTRVFTAPAQPTPGAVTLYALFDDVRTNGLPIGTDAWYRPGTGPSAGIGGTGDQRLVLDAILALRPIAAHLYVTALVAAPIAITIDNLAVDTPAVRAAIAAELAAMQRRRAVPGGGCSRSWIEEAISRAAGEDSHDLTSPAGNVAGVPGTLFTIGAITYV